MPLTLQAGESDVGRPAMSDVLVVEGFSRELGAAGSFGDAGVGAVASGRVGTLEDLCDGVAQAGGEADRGENPPARGRGGGPCAGSRGPLTDAGRALGGRWPPN